MPVSLADARMAAWMAAVGLASVAAVGCTRAVPEFTNEFGSKDEEPQETGGSGSEDTGGDEDTPPDLPAPTPTCDLSEGQACPPGLGLKCVPDDFDEGGAGECVPILGDAAPGEPCTLNQVDNTDNCAAGSYCAGNECYELCGAGAACPGVGTCFEPAWLCLAGCDPLIQDCPGGMGCRWTQDEFYGFQCSPEGGLQHGEPCLGDVYASACGAGLGCVPEQLFPGGCDAQPGGGCCNYLCNTNQPDCGPFGESCLAAELESLPQLGVCGGLSIEFGDIVITEVYADPPSVPINEYRYEYVELLNSSEQEIELGQLSIDDFVGPGPNNILERFSVVGGSGGCQGGSSSCLAPGRRALFIGNLYEGETNGALVFSADNHLIFGAILQPWTRIELFEDTTLTVLSTYRDWPDPGAPPLPQSELPLHRIDVGGADEPGNWVEDLPSPGL